MEKNSVFCFIPRSEYLLNTVHTWSSENKIKINCQEKVMPCTSGPSQLHTLLQFELVMMMYWIVRINMCILVCI